MNSLCLAKSYRQECRRLPSSRGSGGYTCVHNGPCEIHFQVSCVIGVSDGGGTNVVDVKAAASSQREKNCAIKLNSHKRAKMMAEAMPKYGQDCGVRTVMANALTLNGVSLKHEPRCCRRSMRSDTRHNPRSNTKMRHSSTWDPTGPGNVTALANRRVFTLQAAALPAWTQHPCCRGAGAES